MPTMSFRCQMLRPGEQTLPHRKTTNNVYACWRARSFTDVEGTRLEWKRNDVFTVPGWLWHEHKKHDMRKTRLYSVTDEPTMRKLGLFREEGRNRMAKSRFCRLSRKCGHRQPISGYIWQASAYRRAFWRTAIHRACLGRMTMLITRKDLLRSAGAFALTCTICA